MLNWNLIRKAPAPRPPLSHSEQMALVSRELMKGVRAFGNHHAKLELQRATAPLVKRMRELGMER